MTLPKVSICVTSYKPSAKPYLDLCIESVKNLDYPKELLDISIVSPVNYAPKYDGVATRCPTDESYGMPFGLNFGIKYADSGSEYLFVLNDDVILTRDCLTKLVSYNSHQIGLLMPIGNDQQGRYYLNTQGMAMGPYKLDEVTPAARGHYLMGRQSPYPSGLILVDTLCLYAFLMHRRVWDKVGPFDENLIGQDDIDYSMRTRQAGFVNAIALDSLVWHAGGASNTLTDGQRAKSFEIFNKKWGL